MFKWDRTGGGRWNREGGRETENIKRKGGKPHIQIMKVKNNEEDWSEESGYEQHCARKKIRGRAVGMTWENLFTALVRRLDAEGQNHESGNYPKKGINSDD